MPIDKTGRRSIAQAPDYDGAPPPAQPKSNPRLLENSLSAISPAAYRFPHAQNDHVTQGGALTPHSNFSGMKRPASRTHSALTAKRRKILNSLPQNNEYNQQGVFSYTLGEFNDPSLAEENHYYSLSSNQNNIETDNVPTPNDTYYQILSNLSHDQILSEEFVSNPLPEILKNNYLLTHQSNPEADSGLISEENDVNQHEVFGEDILDENFYNYSFPLPQKSTKNLDEIDSIFPIFESNQIFNFSSQHAFDDPALLPIPIDDIQFNAGEYAGEQRVQPTFITHQMISPPSQSDMLIRCNSKDELLQQLKVASIESADKYRAIRTWSRKNHTYNFSKKDFKELGLDSLIYSRLRWTYTAEEESNPEKYQIRSLLSELEHLGLPKNGMQRQNYTAAQQKLLKEYYVATFKKYNVSEIELLGYISAHTNINMFTIEAWNRTDKSVQAAIKIHKEEIFKKLEDKPEKYKGKDKMENIGEFHYRHGKQVSLKDVAQKFKLNASSLVIAGYHYEHNYRKNNSLLPKYDINTLFETQKIDPKFTEKVNKSYQKSLKDCITIMYKDAQQKELRNGATLATSDFAKLIEVYFQIHYKTVTGWIHNSSKEVSEFDNKED